MSRIAYVNGQYVSHAVAGISIDDRGFLFADGVYEVCEVYGGALVDETRHLDRLARSLNELHMQWPLSRRALEMILREVIARNRVKDGMVYIEITRGAAKRDHVFPPKATPLTLVVTAKSIDREAGNKASEHGIKVISVPDNRWSRVDIKSVSLLPNVLARQTAKEQDAKEAWFVDTDGFVTEGAATNAWIITRDNVLVTRSAETGILRGITRQGVMDICAKQGLKVEERSFTVEDAYNAKEAFITAATTLIMPVVKINDHVIGNGQAGEITLRLRAMFHDHVERKHVCGNVSAPI
jgi:D-alanine transaminase